MVGKLTNKKIIQIFKNVHDEEVRAVLLHDGIGLCSLKFIYDHEKEFRKIMPTYLDKYLEKYHSRHDATAYYNSTSYADRESFMAYMCLETGVVDVKDFRTVVNFSTAGIDIKTLSYFAPSSAELFLDGVLNLSDGVKKLLDFVEERPEYLNYFLPLMCSKDNIDFYNALMDYIKSAGLQDSLRVHIFETMLCSHDSNFLLRFIDEIDKNNYYRFKALNDAAVLMGDYTVILPSKELVAVLK
ncbi:MAG: hypothetical protein K2H06_00300, partial [Anaeroplasmataceae bacterium]|nr:hypothetical protein [Anaeroplasmataceae bacterium]